MGLKTDIIVTPRHTPRTQIIPPKFTQPHNDPHRQAIEHTIREMNKIIALLWNEIAKKKDI